MLITIALFTFLVLSFIVYKGYQSYMHLPKVLARQAKKLQWKPVHQSDERDVYFIRGDNRAVVYWKNKNINILEPMHDESFNNFHEVEQWLETVGEDFSKEVDKVWGHVTDKIAEVMQSVFMKVYEREALEEYTDTRDVPTAVRLRFSEMVNKAANEMGVNPALMLLIIHQYIDGDSELRKDYTCEWVKFMVSRPSIAPQPETYIDYMNEVYFNKKRI